MEQEQIEFIDATNEVTLPAPVKKQVWDGEKFVPVMMYRHIGVPTKEQQEWLETSFGKRNNRWGFSITGGWIMMDEQVYTWFQLKWGNK